MTHPYQLHATAALWSLRKARRALNAAAATQQASMAINAAATLRSPRYGVRHGSGGHSDPIGDALATAAARASRYEDLAERTTATLAWLARYTAAGPGDPLGRLLDAVPGLQPTTAFEVWRWTCEADQRLRQALQLAPDRAPLIGVPCPSCGTRRLEAQTSSWDRACWTVICAAGCTCPGPGCPCGMPAKALGALHIWAASSPLLEHHLATLGARTGG